jgi:hypothetical protein
MALPFTLKRYLKADEELWTLKYFTRQEYNLQKSYKIISESKRNQNPTRLYQLSTQAKI